MSFLFRFTFLCLLLLFQYYIFLFSEVLHNRFSLLILLKQKNISFHLVSFQYRKGKLMIKDCHKSKCMQCFTVTLRGVRDQFTTIMLKYKSKPKKEINETGLGGEELTKYEQLLKDPIERYEESERKSEESASYKKPKTIKKPNDQKCKKRVKKRKRTQVICKRRLRKFMLKLESVKILRRG